jgi:type VII secretion integral membrane protein EccD
MDAAGGAFGSVDAEFFWCSDHVPDTVTVTEVSVSRVCIHADRDGDPQEVDVALPSGAPVAELLPAIVELVDDRPWAADVARRWRLDRPSGDGLEESLSLADNGVRDGDLLVLSSDQAPVFGPLRRTAYHAVTTAQSRVLHPWDQLPDCACVLAGVLAALMLASTAGSPGAAVNAVIAAVCAAAATAATVAAGHDLASGVMAVALVCATGFLAVPSGPAAPNVFLAATAAFTAALLLQRVSGRTVPALTAAAALSLLTAAATLVALPVGVVGAALSTGSVALLAVAPRLSVLTAGLGSGHHQGDAAARAVTGHATLTGFVAAGAAGAGSGVVVVAMAPNVTAPGAITFTTVIAAVLLLRARSYVDPPRRIALAAGGLVSVVTVVYLTVSAHRGLVGAAAGVLVIGGLLAARRPRFGAPVARLLDVLEYGALAAVLPAACWMLGGFHL